MIERRDDLSSSDEKCATEHQQSRFPLPSPDEERHEKETGLEDRRLVADDQDGAEGQGGEREAAAANREAEAWEPGDRE